MTLEGGWRDHAEAGALPPRLVGGLAPGLWAAVRTPGGQALSH